MKPSGPGLLCDCCEALATASVSLVIICLQDCFWMGVSPTKSLGVLDCPWLCLKGPEPKRGLSGSLRLRHGCLLSGPCAGDCLWLRGTETLSGSSGLQMGVSPNGSLKQQNHSWTAAVARFEISIRPYRIIRGFSVCTSGPVHGLCLGGGWFILKRGTNKGRETLLWNFLQISEFTLKLLNSNTCVYFRATEEWQRDWDRSPEICLSL